jgi:hypothetical protein
MKMGMTRKAGRKRGKHKDKLQACERKRDKQSNEKLKFIEVRYCKVRNQWHRVVMAQHVQKQEIQIYLTPF